MTVQELVYWCNENDIPLDTQIALRAKDDYFLTEESVYIDNPYFGNSREGEAWLEENAPKDEDGCVDYDSDDFPNFIILDTGRG